MIDDCKNLDSMTENKMNLQFLEVHDFEHLNVSFELKETMLSLNEESVEKSGNSDEKVHEIEKSYEGLIKKELPKHLKYAFLRDKKNQNL